MKNVKSKILIVIQILTFFLGFSKNALADEYVVTCKAKLAQSDLPATAAVVKGLPVVSQTDLEIFHQVKIDDLVFELHEKKLVFFFQPVIRFPNGQEITTTGFFDDAGTILLRSTSPLANGATRTADIRCCRDCTFNDWPK